MAVGVESVESSPSSDLLRQGRPRKAEDISGVGTGAKGFFFSFGAFRKDHGFIRSDPMEKLHAVTCVMPSACRSPQMELGRSQNTIFAFVGNFPVE
jgi:hypothetical protein